MKQCLCKEIGQYSVETFLAVPIHGLAHMILFPSISPIHLQLKKDQIVLATWRIYLYH